MKVLITPRLFQETKLKGWRAAMLLLCLVPFFIPTMLCYVMYAILCYVSLFLFNAVLLSSTYPFALLYCLVIPRLLNPLSFPLPQQWANNSLLPEKWISVAPSHFFLPSKTMLLPPGSIRLGNYLNLTREKLMRALDMGRFGGNWERMDRLIDGLGSRGGERGTDTRMGMGISFLWFVWGGRKGRDGVGRLRKWERSWRKLKSEEKALRSPKKKKKKTQETRQRTKTKKSSNSGIQHLCRTPNLVNDANIHFRRWWRFLFLSVFFRIVGIGLGEF